MCNMTSRGCHPIHTCNWMCGQCVPRKYRTLGASPTHRLNARSCAGAATASWHAAHRQHTQHGSCPKHVLKRTSQLPPQCKCRAATETLGVPRMLRMLSPTAAPSSRQHSCSVPCPSCAHSCLPTVQGVHRVQTTKEHSHGANNSQHGWCCCLANPLPTLRQTGRTHTKRPFPRPCTAPSCCCSTTSSVAQACLAIDTLTSLARTDAVTATTQGALQRLH